MAGHAEAMEELARRVAAALEAGDLTAFRDLLHPAARWGPPGHPAPPCRSREDVLSWYRRARDSGARARVAEAVVSGDRILVGLKVIPAPVAVGHGGDHDRWQVLTVRDGQVAEIVGFDDRAEAAAWAGMVPGRWSAPRHRLADELVELRLPEPSDAAELHAYAARPGGLQGTWVPLAGGASLAECEWLIGDWLTGWRTGRSFHGPALIIVRAGESRLVGQVGLGDRGGRTVELDYGVAPEYRRRGYASRATILVADWLLRGGQADEVELRIGRDNLASQRVAAAAGFAPAGTVVSHVPGTGETYEDLRFVLQLSRNSTAPVT
jgi:RimJ/RimL family protein N-acetyltransferase/ketosteroid isomerase-like protein